jgi:archaeosine synthase beta-subunit
MLMISEQHERPLACWRGKELHIGTIFECLTVIFKTAGCAWNQCLMCGYRHERFASTESVMGQERHLLSQLAWVQERHRPNDYQMVKVFTSGSFFDWLEIPPPVLQKIASAFRGKLVIAETRPEFVTDETIIPFLEKIDDGSYTTPLYCAMGLETSDDRIRKKCIRKGFSYNDFVESARRAQTLGAGVKAYLLLKPLFLTEMEAIDDMKSSIRDVVNNADLISLNPCTVQGHTELEWYWRQGAYRPPYLWSVLSVLNDAPVPITCDPVGGGRKRGPHNCGICDKVIIQGIRDYSLNGDRDLIASLLEMECGCKEEWDYVLDQEMPFCIPLTH